MTAFLQNGNYSLTTI